VAVAPVAGVDPSPMVPSNVARTLRFYDTFPSLGQRAGVEMDVRVCVSAQGSVSDASVEERESRSFSGTFRAAILSWRYRPLMVNGLPTPFCHRMHISYRAS
jgi:hypothetical protein